MDGWRSYFPSIDPSVCFKSHIAIIIVTRMQPTSTAHISIWKRGGYWSCGTPSVVVWSGSPGRRVRESILEGIRAGRQHHTPYPQLGTSQNLTSIFTLDYSPPIKQEAISQEKRKKSKKKSNLHGETMIQHLIGLSVPLAGSGGEDGSAFKVVIQSWSVWMQVERRRWTNRTQYVFFFRRTSDCADRIEKSRT